MLQFKVFSLLSLLLCLISVVLSSSSSENLEQAEVQQNPPAKKIPPTIDRLKKSHRQLMKNPDSDTPVAESPRSPRTRSPRDSRSSPRSPRDLTGLRNSYKVVNSPEQIKKSRPESKDN